MSLSKFREVDASRHALRTREPISHLADNMKPSSSLKSVIKLSVGDPTVDGNLCVPPVLKDAMIDVVRSGAYNGYPPMVGYVDASEAVSNYWKKFLSVDRKSLMIPENVVLVSGVSHAIVLAITAICNEGDNLLIPNPGFTQNKAVCVSYGFEPRMYNCLPDKNWEVDLEEVRRLKDDKTKLMVLTNPSNPCGSNFSRKHVEDIVRVAEELQLPIISDEIYAEVLFKGEVFTSVADIDTCVPRVVLGGTAKNLVVPGWRLGWAILVDRDGVAGGWLDGMQRLAQLHGGSNSVAQMAHAQALLNVPQSHLDGISTILEEGAHAYKKLINFGFTYTPPRASMFVMVKIDLSRFSDVKDDVDFYEKLLEEENVQVMPGSIFGLPGYFRATITRPVHIIDEAVERIGEFCARHAAK